jgi:hypothetical protein
MVIDVRTPREYMFEHVDGMMLPPSPFFGLNGLSGHSTERFQPQGDGMSAAREPQWT